ncbi:hypothetical protein L596_026331 [Steinernema carpocapsae]|uniref:Uncharacterized protein n=1 Tax=Steinernema carpocapsae TaxID=34508 RepID=A0A4U5M154_STECR|nr:hypothetical protein L596_026331 [Steinernema carpocapsae]
MCAKVQPDRRGALRVIPLLDYSDDNIRGGGTDPSWIRSDPDPDPGSETWIRSDPKSEKNYGLERHSKRGEKA